MVIPVYFWLFEYFMS